MSCPSDNLSMEQFGADGPRHLADTRKRLSPAAAFDWQYILQDPLAARTSLAE
jgi:hypothetical protein